MKINKQDLLNLKTLLEDGKITQKKFKNKTIVDGLKQNGSVKKARQTASVRHITILKPENVFLFLKQQGLNITSIDGIDSYINDIFDKKPSRDIIQKQTSNTKVKRSPSLKGLYVSSLENLDIKIDDEVITISPTNGVGIFLFHTQKIEVFEDTTIVGVENYQVVWFAQKYAKFFQDKKVLFVSITPYMLEWIQNIKNEYIHFGDYDLAGVNIYLNKVLPRLKCSKRYSMFIPKNIEYLIKKYGDFKLHKKQLVYINIQSSDTNIQSLIKTIKHYKKGLEQEGLYLLD